MPNLSEHPIDKFAKVLILGDSGSGKTGALASLVKAGYKLKIIDYDNGLPILASKLREEGSDLASVEFETCTNKFQNLNGKPVALQAEAWKKGMAALEKFYKLGLTERDVLVIDTMTLAGEAALHHILKLEGRPAGPPQIQDWGAAMDLIQGMIAMVTSEDFKCNVIVNSHIVYMGDENATRGYPATLGNKLPPKIGRYFNGVLLLRSQGTGAAVTRTLHTSSYINIELKTPNPVVKPTYPIKTGLADYFAALKG